jgi:hypothetical protein
MPLWRSLGMMCKKEEHWCVWETVKSESLRFNRFTHMLQWIHWRPPSVLELLLWTRRMCVTPSTKALIRIHFQSYTLPPKTHFLPVTTVTILPYLLGTGMNHLHDLLVFQWSGKGTKRLNLIESPTSHKDRIQTNTWLESAEIYCISYNKSKTFKKGEEKEKKKNVKPERWRGLKNKSL